MNNTNFIFKKFHNSPNWHVHTANFGRIGSVGAFIDDNGKRQGFEATKPVKDAEGHITGFVTIGTGFVNRAAAANALVEAL